MFHYRTSQFGQLNQFIATISQPNLVFDPNRDMHWDMHGEFEQSHSLLKDLDQQFKANVSHRVLQSSFTFVQCVDIKFEVIKLKTKKLYDNITPKEMLYVI